MVKSFSKYKLIFVPLILVFILSSCSDFQKALKSKDYSLKLVKAKEYYEKEDYYRSESLLNDIIPVYRGTEQAKDIMFMYAYCHYYMGDYIIAVHYFKNFSRTWATDPRAEEADFMVAQCLYNESPRSNLDQSSTAKAIEAYQYFMNMYPTSELFEEALLRQGQLKKRLEQKAYANAKLYYQLRLNKAAVISLKNALKDYPDTEYREDIMFLILKSSYLLAKNSKDDLKIERYQDTINEYYAYIDEFASSANSKEAEQIYAFCVKEIKKQ